MFVIVESYSEFNISQKYYGNLKKNCDIFF